MQYTIKTNSDIFPLQYAVDGHSVESCTSFFKFFCPCVEQAFKGETQSKNKFPSESF